MKRAIEKDLKDWKEREDRKPLLVRGARQVGKTFIIEKFGKENFESSITINFEEMKDLKGAFQANLDPALIIRDLSTRMKTPIIPGKTLLFLDEIQACPEALVSLRFFKEQMPELHLIAAGSLLEFILGDSRYSFPVGRIDYLFMRPLSFKEFLEAKGENLALEWLAEATPQHPIGEASHVSLLRAAKEYFIVGGMPEVVQSFLKTGQFLDLDRTQQSLLATYESDLDKYPRSGQKKFMKLLFEAAPRLIAEHFKYAKIQPHAQSRDYIEALDVLTHTGILHQVFANEATGVPLEGQKNEKKFKLLFLDIGLLPKPLEMVLDAEDMTSVHSGRLAEQFVGQELIAYGKPYRKASLYYWEREKKGSSAEVDYLIEVGNDIIPLEVKSGATGRLRSLKQFMEEKKSPLGVQLSQAPLSFAEGILSVPLYMISDLPRLVKHVMKNGLTG